MLCAIIDTVFKHRAIIMTYYIPNKYVHTNAYQWHYNPISLTYITFTEDYGFDLTSL